MAYQPFDRWTQNVCKHDRQWQTKAQNAFQLTRDVGISKKESFPLESARYSPISLCRCWYWTHPCPHSDRAQADRMRGHRLALLVATGSLEYKPHRCMLGRRTGKTKSPPTPSHVKSGDSKISARTSRTGCESAITENSTTDCLCEPANEYRCEPRFPSRCGSFSQTSRTAT